VVTVGVGVGAPPRPPGLVLGLVCAGRIVHLVAEAKRPPALPRRPHRSLRRAWALRRGSALRGFMLRLRSCRHHVVDSLTRDSFDCDRDRVGSSVRCPQSVQRKRSPLPPRRRRAQRRHYSQQQLPQGCSGRRPQVQLAQARCRRRSCKRSMEPPMMTSCGSAPSSVSSSSRRIGSGEGEGSGEASRVVHSARERSTARPTPTPTRPLVGRRVLFRCPARQTFRRLLERWHSASRARG